MRELEPLKLIFKDRNWYLYAYCRLRMENRLFKLARIHNITPLNTKFDRQFRAFKNMHNMSPSELKNSQNTVKSFTPIRFAITIKGAREMDFKLVKKEAFRVVGVAKDILHDMEKNFTIIPAMWEKACSDGTMDKLCGLMNTPQKGIMGVCECGDTMPWRYAIATASDDENDDSFTEIIVPEATWAIFYGEGTNKSIQDLMMRVHTEWLPSSGYDFGDAPEIEVYYSADPTDAKYEIWLPVVPKA